MLLTNKLLPVALIAALIGGSVGAFVMHSSKDQSGTVATAQDTTRNASDVQYAQYQPASDQFVPAEFKTPAEQIAYKSGFADGFRAAQAGAAGLQATTVSPTRVVYGRRGSARRVYYDYNRQRGRSFWQKHRDKLTLAIGTGAGAAIGGLVGGKKGAGIGALAGLGGSALYTYKLRNRDRRY